MGGFSTALLLYGISLVYGLTGTTNIAGIAGQISALGLQHNIALSAGIALMLCGLCFKVAAAPFHFWTPDVYESAPTSVTAFMSTAPKAAAFAIFGRVLMQGIGVKSCKITSWNIIHPLPHRQYVLSIPMKNRATPCIFSHHSFPFGKIYPCPESLLVIRIEKNGQCRQVKC